MMANRIGRLEFLFWCVASILAGSIVLATLSAIANISIELGRTPHLSQGLVFIAVAVVMLKAHVSRFHDIGWSGRTVLVAFVPLLDVAALLFLLVMPGQKQPNRYGEPTKFLRRLRKTYKANVEHDDTENGNKETICDLKDAN
jgi:uncharacterized membrane protein YhaH (DUF805 family)